MLKSEDLDVVNVHTELKGVGKTEYEEVPQIARNNPACLRSPKNANGRPVGGPGKFSAELTRKIVAPVTHSLPVLVADVPRLAKVDGVLADVDREVADALDRAGDENKVQQAFRTSVAFLEAAAERGDHLLV